MGVCVLFKRFFAMAIYIRKIVLHGFVNTAVVGISQLLNALKEYYSDLIL